MESSWPLSARMGVFGSMIPGAALYPCRTVQDLKVAAEPASSGCVMVVVCWYLVLTAEVSASCSYTWLMPWQKALQHCWASM